MLKAFVLRYWPLAVVCVFVIAILTMSRYAEDRKESNKNNTQQSSPAAPISPDDTGKTGKNPNEAENTPSWINAFAWPEGATVWALFLTLFVIAWQSAETRKAAQATQASAEATAEQSVNIMARERARLSTVLPSMEPQINDIKIMDVDDTQDTVYALSAGVILAVGVVAVALKMGWYELEVFGILASFGNHFYWLYKLYPSGVAGHVFLQFLPSTIISSCTG